MDEHYDTVEAIEAQEAYCRKRGRPFFAPKGDGRCFHCGQNIYKPRRDNSTSGISVERAGAALITSCPHCYYSFVD